MTEFGKGPTLKEGSPWLRDEGERIDRILTVAETDSIIEGLPPFQKGDLGAAAPTPRLAQRTRSRACPMTSFIGPYSRLNAAFAAVMYCRCPASLAS